MTKVTTTLLLSLSALYGCASDDPAIETGFHEAIPGAFNYFIASERPCGSISSNGDRCSYAYDDLGRMTHEDCEGLYIADISYTENPISKTTVIVGYEPGRGQTDIETYSISNGLVTSKEVTVDSESYPDAAFRYDYTRDDAGRMESIAITGSADGQTHFYYDDETSLLARTEYSGDNSAGSLRDNYEVDYFWTESLLTEMHITYPDDVTGGSRIRLFSYNAASEQVSTEYIDENGVSTVWSDDPSCEE
jgi:hypothetical protein